MKRKLILFSALLLLVSFSPVWSQSWVKKATKAVFTVMTFNAEGTLLGSSTGFFVGPQGEAVSSFAPFKGASRAVVIDVQGKEYPVEVILGANDTYDVVKFRVAGAKKVPVLEVSQTPISVGSSAWLLPYREQKQVPQGVVRKAETFQGQYTYYTAALQMPAEAVGAPLLSEEGLVVGLMQQPATVGDSLSYAVSARFADSLRMSGLSINDPNLRAVNIKKALPSDVDQALLTIYLAGSSLDSLAYVELVNDFISQFPNQQDGYVYRAQLAAAGRQFADAERDMAQALRVASKPDEVHYTYSRMIYQQAISAPEANPEWTLDRALAEARDAYSANPTAVYLQQQAYILYAQKQYAEAYQLYEQMFDSPLRSAGLFYEASNCKLMQADTLGQLALLDSAVTLFSRPLLKEAAPYLLARAQARIDAKRFRDAVADLNDYEQLMVAQVNDSFYYLRHQAELGGRLFQQALNDIEKAIEMNPKNEFYYSEKASLQVRVGLYDDAIATANELIGLSPQYSEGYLFLGVAQCLKGQKAEGRENLLKAKALGDEQADGLLERFK